MGQRDKAEPFVQALELMAEAIDSMRFGTLTLIFQDGFPIQLERQEKIRLGAIAAQRRAKDSAWREQVMQAARGLEYGQIELRMQNGKIIQLERTERRRFAQCQGLDGDGI